MIRGRRFAPVRARGGLGGRLALAALAAASAAALAGCGSDEGADDPERPAPSGERADAGGDSQRESERRGDGGSRRARPEPARCPEGAPRCRTASGTIVYVEAVDPDGDGDAHLVLASPDGITAPGVSVIDVPRELRPRPLPGIGERISAAGPVYRGSYGQRQIEAVDLHVAGG